MKRKLLILMLAALPMFAQAAPFVEATVTSGVVNCGVYLDSAAKVNVPVSALKCRYDLSAVSAGTHSVKMTAITADDPIWGTQESVQSAPLNFTRPVPATAPSGLVLVP
jgi:hypothetical protein